MIYEHLGDNRSGKTFTNALFAWEAYNLGRTVYCNCGKDARGRSLHILNFPHRHYQFEELRQMDLYECYVMSDESVEFMDAFDAPKRMMREIGYFGYQATKRGVDWHYDAVRHKNIYNRVRLNPHYYIQSVRYPHNPKLPVQAIKLIIISRYSSQAKTLWMRQPTLGRFFPIFFFVVLVPPREGAS